MTSISPKPLLRTRARHEKVAEAARGSVSSIAGNLPSKLGD
jgi:hypothetical protein